MAVSRPTSAKSKSKMSVTTTKAPRVRTSFLAFAGGMVAAIPLSLAAIIPMVNSEMAGLAKAHTVQVRTAADDLSCSQPSTSESAGGYGGAGGAGGMGGGQVLGASTTAPVSPGTPSGGSGGGMGGGGNSQLPPAVQQLVTVNGSITGPTGPDSNNYVTSNVTENTNITNTNSFSVTSNNTQTAKSGSAEVEHNTTAGAAQSGDATNSNSTSFNFSVTN